MAGHGRELILLAIAVVVLNVPFGYWRAGARRFSLPWFLAVHMPVPAVIGLRVLPGIGFQIATLPITVGAYAIGQFVGGRLRGAPRRAGLKPPAIDALLYDACGFAQTRLLCESRRASLRRPGSAPRPVRGSPAVQGSP